MENEKTNILDVIFMFCCVILFGGLAVAAWVKGVTVGGLVTTVLALLMLFALYGDLKNGVRAPTPYEWFKTWMTVRPFVILVAGLGLMWLGAVTVLPLTQNLPESIKLLIVLVPLLVWVVMVGYTLWQAPQRHEADAAWRKRIRYRTKDNSSI